MIGEITTIPIVSETFAFDKAVELCRVEHSNEWQIGRCLLYALRNENKTIREFCLVVDGDITHEDRYSGWKQAAAFAERGYPESLNVLPISYFADAQTALDDGLDYEDVVEKLLKCAYEENGHKRKQFLGVRYFQAWRRESTGKVRPYEKIRDEILNLAKRIMPLAAGRKDSMNKNVATAAKIEQEAFANLLYQLQQAKRIEEGK